MLANMYQLFIANEASNFPNAEILNCRHMHMLGAD